MKSPFSKIQIGAGFYLNGNWAVKKTSHTVELYRDYSMTKSMGRHYVGQDETCTSRKE